MDTGKYVSGDTLSSLGYSVCEDPTALKVFYVEGDNDPTLRTLVTDSNGSHHILFRRGNDWFTYDEPYDIWKVTELALRVK